MQVMLKLNCIRCVISLAFLRSFFQYQAVDSSKIPDSKMVTPIEFHCSCTYDNKIYNLAPLQRKDGKPRLNAAKPNTSYMYYYNPCRSFSLGPERYRKHNCTNGDVAVCQVANTDYRTVGRQSSFHCGSDSLYLSYEHGDVAGWGVKIWLQCNESLKGEDDGKFDFITDKHGAWEFRLAHNCACPDGCPEPTPTTASTSTRPAAPTTPTTTSTAPATMSTTRSPDNWENTWIPVIVVFGGVFLIIVFCLQRHLWFFVRLVRLWIFGQNIEESERQSLIGEGRNIEQNNFNDLDDGRRNENLSQSKSVSSSSINASKKHKEMENKKIPNAGSLLV